MSFDPYHQWLGIPESEQPANHYRLLGIGLFEDDGDVIESAADRQMAHVRTFERGPHAALSQQILNELSAARLCLLDPERRAAYDAELQRQRLARQGGALVPSQAIPVAQSVVVVESVAPPFVPDLASPSMHGPLLRGGSHVAHRRRSSGWPAVAFTALAAVAIAVPAVYMNLPEKPAPKAAGGAENRATPQSRTMLAEKKTADQRTSDAPRPAVLPTNSDGGETKRFSFDIPEPRRTPQNAVATSAGPAAAHASQALPKATMPPAVPAQDSKSSALLPRKLPPLPAAGALEAARQQVNALFSSERQRAVSASGQLVLAYELLNRARSNRDESMVRCVLAQQSQELATKAGDAVTACRALELIATVYDAGDLLQARASIIEQCLRVPVSEHLSWNNVLLAISVAEGALAAGRFDLAASLVQPAGETVRTKIKNQTLYKKLAALRSSVSAHKLQRDAYDKALATLKEQPEEADANLAAGQYEMLILGDWKAGAARWARLRDPAIDELLQLDRKAYRDAQSRFAAARAWWDAASGAGTAWKRHYELQAKYWLVRAQNAGVAASEDVDIAWAKKVLATPGFARCRFRDGVAAKLYNGADFQTLRAERIDRHVDWGFGERAPDPKVNADGFSIRWSGWFKPPVSGTWRISMHADDGMRLWIDGRKVFDFWHGAVQTQSVDLKLTDTFHTIKIEHNEYRFAAAAVWAWSLIGEGERGTQIVPPEALVYEPVSPYDDPSPATLPESGNSSSEPSDKKAAGARLVLPRASDNPADLADIVGEVAPEFTTSPPLHPIGIAIVSEHFGRSPVLQTHPVDRARPCILKSTVNVPARKRTRLAIDVSHHEQGNWRLIVKANGQTLFEGRVGRKTARNGWMAVSVDLTPFAGKQVALELHNQADDWRFEHAYWSRVEIISQ